MDQTHATWYTPGDWKLPKWWTDHPPVRGNVSTHADQVQFYNGPFVRDVLGHKGGMTKPPATV